MSRTRVNTAQVEDLILGCWFNRNEAMDVAVCERLQMQEPVSAAAEFIILYEDYTRAAVGLVLKNYSSVEQTGCLSYNDFMFNLYKMWNHTC
jgi:hypothetical protein